MRSLAMDLTIQTRRAWYSLQWYEDYTMYCVIEVMLCQLFYYGQAKPSKIFFVK